MDYEKKYKESMAKMSAFLAKHDGFTISKDGEMYKELSEIFSEIRESEDERIRKKLLSSFKGIMADADEDELWYGLPYNDIIAWFEKQVSEPNWCHHNVDLSNCSEEYRKAYYDGWNNCNIQHSQCKSELDDVIKCLINGMKFYYEDNKEATWGTDKWSMPVKHIIEVLEQILANSAKTCNVERKPVVKVEPKFKVGDIIQPKDRGHEPWQIMQVDISDKKYRFKDGYVIHFSHEDNYELVEHNPAWSVEDEVGLGDAMWAIKQAKTIAKDENDMGNLWYAERWLKSLKDRVQPQWSKENKVMLDEIIDFFENGTVKLQHDLSLYASWLKSLRPQNTWKPSEEMLEALYRVIPENVMEKSEDEILLDKLYQGLKYGRVLSEK